MELLCASDPMPYLFLINVVLPGIYASCCAGRELVSWDY